MTKRIESPSSINTFKQCKRKYYYQYIEKLPTISNIHQVRGNIAHATLEDFFDIDISSFSQDNYDFKLKAAAQKLFFQKWQAQGPQLKLLQLHKDQERFYFEETMLMIMNWTNHLIEDLNKIISQKKVSIQEAFQELTPIREQEYKSETYSVHGFIDAIQHLEGGVHIIDYKTNANFEVKDSIKLQLAIYSLLYFEKHKERPSKVGIFFLRHQLKLIPVDEELMELARREIELTHGHTDKSDHLDHYPKTVSKLCRWSSGQCDFYEMCKPQE
ncbi:PD-(D/E)XK nuclease family protein [Candidatus Woesearchaeota archaeon]|nr:PD-(D/E)XK nuclease family protein [Candidatus Woesearchaeota archaeon]